MQLLSATSQRYNFLLYIILFYIQYLWWKSIPHEIILENHNQNHSSLITNFSSLVQHKTKRIIPSTHPPSSCKREKQRLGSGTATRARIRELCARNSPACGRIKNAFTAASRFANTFAVTHVFFLSRRRPKRRARARESTYFTRRAFRTRVRGKTAGNKESRWAEPACGERDF